MRKKLRQKPDVCGQFYCLFDTPIGACGLAWSADGLTRLNLPEDDRQATELRLLRDLGEPVLREPPVPIKRAIREIQAYLAGKKTDFSSIALDLGSVAPFHRKVYGATRAIGWGRTASYGEIAARAGSKGAARAVGQALARNPISIIVPCHRILASGGKAGGFSAYGGLSTKRNLLALEGVTLLRA